MVDFCENCGAIILGKKGEDIKCPACGTVNKAKSSVKLTQKIETKEELEIMNSDVESETHPITKEECPKCGNEEAHYWTKQTRSSDEPETQFFKCTKCKHQWRDYR